jgi:uncharacterized membrane protein
MTRADWFTLVRFLHILGAVVALGFSLSYGLWLARAEVAGGGARPFALRTISWIDRRLTTPAYVVQLVTGLVLVFLLDASLLRQAWLELSIGLYAAVVALAMSVYAPAHRRQTALAERLAAGEPVEAEYAEVSAKARRYGLLVTGLTLLILVLMVFRPALWS